VLIILTAVVPASAQLVSTNTLLSILQGREGQAWGEATQITDQWTFKCSADNFGYQIKDLDESALPIYLKIQTTLSLAQGLASLSAVNPSLKSLAVKNLQKSIFISCENIKALGAANPFFKTLKVKGYALSIFLSFLDLPLNYLKQNPELIKGAPLLFHEILHLAYLDNYPSNIHNDVMASNIGDVIYSCTEVATGGRDLDSCAVCALAFSGGRGTRLLSSNVDIAQAEATCQQQLKTSERTTLTTDKLEKINNL
jgi:hypothetical protein